MFWDSHFATRTLASGEHKLSGQTRSISGIVSESFLVVAKCLGTFVSSTRCSVNREQLANEQQAARW